MTTVMWRPPQSDDAVTTTTAGRRRRLLTVGGLVGGVLGVAAGLVQALVGGRIPQWTGDKAEPVALGVLTVVLSLLAVAAVRRQRDPALSVAGRAVCALGQLVPGLLCFSTVGRLWFVPGALLLASGAATVRRWRATAQVLGRHWARCLLVVLGGSELLMAAGAERLPMLVGAVGGCLLAAAAWRKAASRRSTAVLLAIGTLPFAALTWSAVVPLLLLVVTAAVAVPLLAGPAAGPPTMGAPELRRV